MAENGSSTNNSNVGLQVSEREGRGKNDARRLRVRGMVPAVLYGPSGEAGSTVLAVPDKIVDYTLSHVGDNALYDMHLGGRDLTARIVDVHRHPVSGKLLHIDFAPVNMRERIVVTVPVAVTGESVGVSEGGVLQQVAYEIELETLPGDIPEQVELDVSSLLVNENLTLGDIPLPAGAILQSDPEEIAATVTAPTEITDEEMEAAGIVEEPTDAEEAAEAAEGEPDTAGEGEAGSGTEEA